MQHSLAMHGPVEKRRRMMNRLSRPASVAIRTFSVCGLVNRFARHFARRISGGGLSRA
jgi:hypothetical protein